MDIPFVRTKVIMQDASGIPALVDLVRELRGKVRDWGMDPSHVHPEIPGRPSDRSLPSKWMITDLKGPLRET